MADIKALKKDLETRMKKSIEAFKVELKRLRTGRATPDLIKDIKIEYYGQQIELSKIASIIAPEPRLLVIQPWDKSIIGEIERAIQKSGLGLNPQSDGNIIRIPIPPLSEETRQQLVKIVGSHTEKTRVSIRNIRQDGMNKLKRWEKEKEISEDERKRAEKEIEELTKKYIDEAAKIRKEKEKELMED